MFFSKEQATALRARILTGSARPAGRGGCWVWQRATLSGYGVLRVGKTLLLARRVAYLAYRVKPALGGSVVRARCGNRLCVNPRHLYPGKGKVGGSKTGHNGRHKHPPYPWDTWLAFSRLALVRGQDYHCTTKAMVAQLRGAAAARGVSVSVRSSKTVLHVTVRRKRDTQPA